MTSVNRDERTRVVVPEDDSLHKHARSDSPWWNESSWFGFMIPERKIDAIFYTWHRPNMGITAAGVALWDPYGAEKHNCLYYDWYNFNPLPDGADMFDYELANGMRCELLEPLKRYKLDYHSDNCTIDLLWEGVTEPLNLHFQANTGFEDFGGFHYEQFGHITGKVILGGETIPVDCHHVRDRSWGVRGPLKNMVGGGLELGWVSEDLNFCATMRRPEPRKPLTEVSTDVMGYGQFVKDGVHGIVVDGQRRVVERAKDGRPLRIVYDLKDQDGRTLHAEGKVENWLNYHDLWFLYWGLVDWEIEGQQGWGETQDWMDITVARAHQRQALTGRG
jgi:hypothetical protein